MATGLLTILLFFFCIVIPMLRKQKTHTQTHQVFFLIKFFKKKITIFQQEFSLLSMLVVWVFRRRMERVTNEFVRLHSVDHVQASWKTNKFPSKFTLNFRSYITKIKQPRLQRIHVRSTSGEIVDRIVDTNAKNSLINEVIFERKKSTSFLFVFFLSFAIGNNQMS